MCKWLGSSGMAGSPDARTSGDGDLDDRHRSSGKDAHASLSTLAADALVADNPHRVLPTRRIAILGALVVLAISAAAAFGFLIDAVSTPHGHGILRSNGSRGYRRGTVEARCVMASTLSGALPCQLRDHRQDRHVLLVPDLGHRSVTGWNEKSLSQTRPGST